MLVVHCLNHFLPEHTAGTEVYTWALCKELQTKNINVEIVIPNYGEGNSTQYVYDGISVYMYAEPTVVDREVIMGFRAPDGLKEFEKYLDVRKPDVVHFHEIAGSNGITLGHVSAVKKAGIKTIMTFHLATATCKTGSLVFKEETLCDGYIDLDRCSACYLSSKVSVGNYFFYHSSKALFKLGLNTTTWKNKVGTVLGTHYLIKALRQDFLRLVQECETVVAISNWYMRILILNGVPKEKIIFIPQGLPHTQIEPRTVWHREKEVKSTPLRLIFLGRISAFKGLHILLEAIQDFTNDEVSLSIYGQSDDVDYEAKLRNLSLQKSNIFWHQRVDQKNVVRLMSQFDVLCLCSTFSEMSPLVIQEAFAAGIPVLASDVYGNAEQIKENVNGWLFKFKDVKALREKIAMLLKNKNLVRNASSSNGNLRSFESIANSYINIYSSDIAPKNCQKIS